MIFSRSPFVLAAVALLGCSTPQLDAICGPTAGRDGIACTVKNDGSGSGRAGVTARQRHPRTRREYLSRRAFTNELAPGENVVIPVEFPGVDIAEVCGSVPRGGWVCSGSVVEDNVRLGQNLPD